MPVVPIEEYSKPAEARDYLASNLSMGNLALFLGAGVSMDLGLPGWGEFIDNLAKLTGITMDKSAEAMGVDELETVALQIEKKVNNDRDFLDAACECLYTKSGKAIAIEPVDLLTDPTVASLAPLLIGSKRGRIKDVITLNYDSVLEEYLALTGHLVQSIPALPALCGDEDVLIYHPHGYLPSPQALGRRSKEILLSKVAVFSRIGAEQDNWRSLLRSYVRSKIFVFVGLSENSLKSAAFAPVFAAEAASLKDTRLSGVWLFRHPIAADVELMLREMNIAPVVADGSDGVRAFLLSVVQRAAENLMS